MQDTCFICMDTLTHLVSGDDDSTMHISKQIHSIKMPSRGIIVDKNTYLTTLVSKRLRHNVWLKYACPLLPINSIHFIIVGNLHWVAYTHRPHSRQVTGARCTGVVARQSWAEYYPRPTTDSRHQGWAIKYFFVLSEMLTICEQPLYVIVLMILYTNKSRALIKDQNSQLFLKSI